MRYLTSGRCPAGLPETVHMHDYRSTNGAVIGDLINLSGGVSVVDGGPLARELSLPGTGTATSDDDGRQAAELQFSCSVGIAFSWYGGAAVLFSMEGDGTGEASNALSRILITASGNILVEWEEGSQDAQSFEFATRLREGVRTVIHAVRYPDPASPMDDSRVELYVGGHLFGEQGPTVVATGGTEYVLRVGAGRDDQFFEGVVSWLRVDATRITPQQAAEDVLALMGAQNAQRGAARVLVTDAADFDFSEAVDLSDLGGYDILRGLRSERTVDQKVQEATITLARAASGFMASPDVEGSPFNRTPLFSPTGTPTRLVSAGRLIRIYVGQRGDDLNYFEGRITHVEGGGNSDLVVRASDLGGDLLRGFVEEQIELPVTKLGEDGAPAGRATLLNTMQEIANTAATRGWLPSAPTVVFRGDPSGVTLAIRTDTQNQLPIIEAMQRLCDQAAAIIRYRWRDETQTHELSLWRPDRQRSAADVYIPATHYESIDTYAETLLDVRNVVRTQWRSDAEDMPTLGVVSAGGLDSAGDPLPRTYLLTDDDLPDSTGSIAKYRRQPTLIPSLGTNQIDTADEIQRLAEDIIRDWREPLVNAQITLRGAAYAGIEVGDIIALGPDGERTDQVRVLAVTSSAVTFSENDGVRVIVGLRGRPSGNRTRWRQLDARPGGPLAPVTDFNSVLAGLSDRMRNIGLVRVQGSAVLTGGRLAGGIFNTDFASSLLRADQADQWSGAWSDTGFTLERTNQRSGRQSLRVRQGASGSLVSGRMAVEGGKPYRLDVLAQQEKTAGDGVFLVFARWLTAEGAEISTTGLTVAPGTANTWVPQNTTTKSPATARYVEINMGWLIAPTDPLSEMLIDRAHIVPVEPRARMYLNTSTPLVKDDWVRVPFDVADYDYTDTLTTGAAAEFVVPEAGTYAFTAAIGVDVPTGIVLRIGSSTSGTSAPARIAEQVTAIVTGVNAASAASAEVELNPGDKIAVWARMVDASDGKLITGDGATWFTVRRVETGA